LIKFRESHFGRIGQQFAQDVAVFGTGQDHQALPRKLAGDWPKLSRFGLVAFSPPETSY